MTAACEVVLLRHAATAAPERCHGQRSDPPLSPEGRRAATAVGARLGAFDRVLRSPARRAAETVAACGLGADVAVDPRWAERDLGEWEGRPWADCWPEAPPSALADAASYVAFTPPGAEPTTAVEARVRAALAELPRAGGRTLVVTHAGPIRLAVAACLGLDAAAAVSLDPAPATAVWLTSAAGTWRLQRFGWS